MCAVGGADMNTELFTKDDVVPETHYADFTGQWLVLDVKTSVKNEWMKAEAATKRNQLFFARSGFGCDPNKMGRKIFGTFASDFDGGYIVCREEVFGIAKPETIEAWKEAFPEIADHIERTIKQDY